MKIYNSLSKKVEDFLPLGSDEVKFYSCGMTVYDYAHIGHGRKYVTDDLLRRTLEYLGYKVNFVQNVTDVGHLTSDADSGQDKLEKGAKASGKTVWGVADYYTKHFYDSMGQLNIKSPDVICRATEHIKPQIELIKKIMKNGYAYDTPEAVYFDVSKFEDYEKLFGQSLKEKKVSVRKDVKEGKYKKNPADFALWFKRVGRFKNHVMHWDSPWGDGFPGWHIECSAMSMHYLGEQIDIHTGGEDHKPIHHPNEIAQSEAATGKKPFVKYWVHTSFLTVEGTKMSKSLKNFFTVQDVVDKGYDPLSLRYFYLTAHYRKALNFNWDALESASVSLGKLREHIRSYKGGKRNQLSDDKLQKIDKMRDEFLASISEDLNAPKALSVLWKVVKSNIPSPDKAELILDFDRILGLGLADYDFQIPPEVLQLAKKREDFRKRADYKSADKLRKKIDSKGFVVKDSPRGFELFPKQK